MQITMIGAGYVGLVSGACFAELGHNVTCVDVDEEKIARLNDRECPIYEPGLEELLAKNLAKERLTFTTDLVPSVRDAEIIFIAVGTPSSRRGNGYADMQYVHDAARSIAPYLEGYTVIVNKSTVPVGSAIQVERIIRDENPHADFDVASNPEFLREGAAIRDFMAPDRIAIGTNSSKARNMFLQVYEPLKLADSSFVITNPETAELTKYASNAFLATKVSFINEMANLCEVVGADVQDLARGMGLDARIGSKFLNAGPGYGGSCFPKDTLALLRLAQEHGAHCRITEMAVEVNNAQKARMVGKIRKVFGGALDGRCIAVLGLTFKPETDDMREAPALTILPALLERGANIRAHDPVGIAEAKKIMPELHYCDDPYEVCDGADAACILTDWSLYRELDLVRIKNMLRRPIMIDLRNVYRPGVLKELGFQYFSVGRKDVC